jgi:hypothetical protein
MSADEAIEHATHRDDHARGNGLPTDERGGIVEKGHFRGGG